MEQLIAYSELYFGLGHKQNGDTHCFVFLHTQGNPVVTREHDREQSRHLIDLFTKHNYANRADIFLICNLDRGLYPNRISLTLVRGAHAQPLDIESPAWESIARDAMTKKDQEDGIVTCVAELFFGDEKNFLHSKISTLDDAQKFVVHMNGRVLDRLRPFHTNSSVFTIAPPDREIVMTCDCSNDIARNKPRRRR